MNEYDETQEDVIPLPPEVLAWLERALQWPEDLAEYDRINAVTNLTELAFITQ